jgi:hypothetical protein
MERDNLGQQEYGKDWKMKAPQDAGQWFVVARQAPKARPPAEAALDHPAARQQHEALLRFGQLDHVQVDAVGLGVLPGLLAGIAVVGPGELDRLAGGLLHYLAQHLHLGALLLVGRRDVYRQQVSERVDRQVHLAAFPALVAVVAGACPALAARLQGAAIEHHRARLALTAQGHTDSRAQVHHHRLEAARLQSAPGLLIDRLPDGKSLGKIRQGDPARAI